MSYTPPLGNAVELFFSGEPYTAPLGGAIQLDWRIPLVLSAGRVVALPDAVGTGTFTPVGAAALDVPGVISGSGSQTVLMRGIVELQAIVSGIFEPLAYGEVAITASPVVSGIGWVPVTGEGDIVASAFVSGTMWRHYNLFGNVVGQGVFSNSVSVTSYTVAGAVTANPAVSGSGNFIPVFPIQGAITVSPVVSSAMQHKVVAAGNIVIPGVISGLGGIPTTYGIGALVGQASLNGFGNRGASMFGNPVIQPVMGGKFYRPFDGGNVLSIPPVMVGVGAFASGIAPHRLFGRAIAKAIISGSGTA